MKLRCNIFPVDTTPYCIWGYELLEDNLNFISGIDSTYFEYIAKTHYENLDSEDSHRAAISLRVAYHHGLETLFMLMFAALQAPECVVGWTQKSWPKDLKSIMTKIKVGNNIPNKLGLTYVSWNALAETMILYTHTDTKRVEETKQLFATLWSRFGEDYLSDNNIEEYNSIKHGFRTGLGGFALAMGQTQMHTFANSKFGTHFFIDEKINGAPKIKNDRHFQLHHCSLNWHPESLAHSLNLIALSIENIVSFLKIKNGVDPKIVPFSRPFDSAYFDSPWDDDYSVGVNSMSRITYVYEKEIKRLTEQELINVLKEYGFYK